MKTWKHLSFVAILAIFGIVGVLTACDNGNDNGDNSGTQELSGTVTLTLSQLPQNGTDGIIRYGDTLTANVNSENKSGTPSYEWDIDGTKITGNESYIIPRANVGKTIKATVAFSGNSGNISSTPTTAVLYKNLGENGTIYNHSSLEDEETPFEAFDLAFPRLESLDSETYGRFAYIIVLFIDNVDDASGHKAIVINEPEGKPGFEVYVDPVVFNQEADGLPTNGKRNLAANWIIDDWVIWLPTL